VSLRDVIVDEIQRVGPIPFSRYMDLCLYHPELGYYSRPVERFGKDGDFYTASDVHAVFGRLMSRQFEEMWRVLGSPSQIDVVELGPGRGLFAGDVLDWSAKQFTDLFSSLRYVLVEQSAALRDRLRHRLAEHVETGKVKLVSNLEEISAMLGNHLIVFANEFFDAMPVEVIDYRGAVRVAQNNGAFVEHFATASAEELRYLDCYGFHPEIGERCEVSRAALDWMRRIAALLHGRSGFVVLIDYGYTREQQLAGRHRDTLMSYQRHRARLSPYDAPGEQDITAHVNFTALRQAAVRHGLESLALLTQSQFLIGIGERSQFADAFEECKLPQEQTKVALQLKHLISPEGMGEVFQVLLLMHGVAKEKATQLSGLSLLR